MTKRPLLEAVYANVAGLRSQVAALLAAGADPNAMTGHGESPLRVAANNGRFDVVRLLLDHGGDIAQLRWDAVSLAAGIGDQAQLAAGVEAAQTLENRDCWGRTPLLLAILSGDPQKVAMLIEAGADVTAVGRCDKPPLAYAIQRDDVAMLRWLLDYGFDAEQRDQFAYTPLIMAAEAGAFRCVEALIAHGVDLHAVNHVQESAITVTCDARVVAALVAAGADINDLGREYRAQMLGYRVDEAPDASEGDYRDDRHPVFGTANPACMDRPFWQAMVRCGGSAYLAARKFNRQRDIFEDGPIWCYDRFGKSITALPDGRFVEIAGEHEDYYDPDFCIYNDVLVHDGAGNCTIYGYPRAVFPPTDFHTATLVGRHIYVIGNLGYQEDRRPGCTQVYRLDLDDFSMARLETGGDLPGWISRHKATCDSDGGILVTGGMLSIDTGDGKQDYVTNPHDYVLRLDSLTWRRLA